MFEPFAPAIDAFAKRLARNYREVFGKAEPDHAHLLRAVAKPALERIAATDALYHDALHTLAVAEVGQAVLRGRAMVEPVSRECWLHLTVATLLHDVGYLRGTCPGDGNGRYVVDAADLVGQLADPAYPRKPAALYREPRETGVAERLGYRDPADLAEQCPRFFWGEVGPYVGPALAHLGRAAAGRPWAAQLYAHVFVEEHVRHRLGTERGVPPAGGMGGELRVVAAEARPELGPAPAVARRQLG